MNKKRNYPRIINIQLEENKKTFTMKEMYEFFKLVYPEHDISYNLYSEVVSRYNKKLVDNLFKGQNITLGCGLGVLRIKKVERKFNHKKIDWGETNKLKSEGINRHVYYTDDYWYRFSWFKGYKIRNKTVYRFIPTKGVNGITKKFANHMKSDDFADLNFRQ